MARKEFDNKKAGEGGAARKIKPRSSPLTLAEFRSVFGKVKSLGLTWTADITPHLIAKEPRAEAALPSLQSTRIQEKYPTFPSELGAVVLYTLTGMTLGSLGADKKLLEKKASVVRQSGLITESYRAEFFFKHAIKVPYFSDLDWEVVVKKYERNVLESPGISYALLSLEFERPGTEGSEKRRAVVAVDERLTEKLIKLLAQVKEALEKSRSTHDIFPEKAKSKEKDDAVTNSTTLLEQAGKRPS
jgi:hypothetical protein